MNGRLEKLFDIISRRQHPLAISALAEQLGVSSRTVRNDIANINRMFDKLGYVGITIQRGLISFDPETISEQEEKIITELNFRYTVNKRHLWLQLPLLCNEKYLTLAALCKWMDLSRSTVINSLERVRNDLKERGLALQSLQKHGYIIQGGELQIRDYAVGLISSLFFDNDNNSLTAREFEQILDIKATEKTIWANCLQVASEIEEFLGEEWTDESYRRVTAALYVSALRRTKNEYIPDADCKLISSTRNFNMIQAVLDANLSAFEILRKEDLCFVMRYILTAVCVNISYYKKENQVRVPIFASKILSAAYHADVELDKLYDSLQEQLCEYLNSAYYRVKLSCNADLIAQDGGTQENINDIIKKTLESFFGNEPPENEIHYVNALLDGKKILEITQKNRKYHTVLISDRDTIYNIALKREAERIDERIEVVEVHPLHKVNMIRLGEYDIIISTKPLNLPQWNTDFVVDNNGNWHAALLAHIAKTPPKKTKTLQFADGVTGKLLKIVEQETDKETFRQIGNRIYTELGPNFFNRGNKMLKDILKPETIMINAHADTWEQAVVLSGRLMLDAGCIKACFIDAMLEMVRENGPYVVIAPGIAMPHARPENGALRTCMSLVTLDSPVEFGNPENDPVYIVIGLAATDNSSHLDALSELVDILGDKEKYQAILKAKTAKEIGTLLK